MKLGSSQPNHVRQGDDGGVRCALQVKVELFAQFGQLVEPFGMEQLDLHGYSKCRADVERRDIQVTETRMLLEVNELIEVIGSSYETLVGADQVPVI